MPINCERFVLAPKHPRRNGMQVRILGGEMLGVLPDLHQGLGVKLVQAHQCWNLVVQMLDHVRCERLDDASEGDAIVLGWFREQDVFLIDGQTFRERFMTFGVSFHCTRTFEHLFSRGEQIVVFGFVVVFQRGTDLLVEKEKVCGFLGRRLNGDGMVPGCIQGPDDSVMDLGHLSCTPKRCMVLWDGLGHCLWVNGGDQRIVVVGEA